MSDLDWTQKSLKKAIGDFLVAVQIQKVISLRAFEDIEAQAMQLACLLKDSDLISKSSLNKLHTAAKVLRAEAPYMEGKSTTLIKMAEKLELTVDLILRDECHSDRVPGVPRIV